MKNWRFLGNFAKRCNQIEAASFSGQDIVEGSISYPNTTDFDTEDMAFHWILKGKFREKRTTGKDQCFLARKIVLIRNYGETEIYHEKNISLSPGWGTWNSNFKLKVQLMLALAHFVMITILDFCLHLDSVSIACWIHQHLGFTLDFVSPRAMPVCETESLELVAHY